MRFIKQLNPLVLLRERSSVIECLKRADSLSKSICNFVCMQRSYDSNAIVYLF